MDVPHGPGVLASLPAFQRFRSTLDARCAEPPVLTVPHEVSSDRFRCRWIGLTTGAT